MNKEIVTSTGRLGASRRSYRRVAVNATEFSDNPSRVPEFRDRFLTFADKHKENIAERFTFRGMVSNDVMTRLRQPDTSSYLEAALPVGEFSGDDSWLVYLAKNHGERAIPLVPREQMIVDFTVDRERREKHPGLTPSEKTEKAVQEGYTLVSTFTKEENKQILNIWGETFEWTAQEIENLRLRLEAGKKGSKKDKNTWFSGLKNNKGEFVSISLGEKLTLPIANGQTIDLIESTDWRVVDEESGNGAMATTVSALNAQILHDYKGRATPLIYAECNFQSRADRAGMSAGFDVPDRAYAPQILIQNVDVGDVEEYPDNKQRDFHFMYLSQNTIQEKYDPKQVASIMKKIDVE